MHWETIESNKRADFPLFKVFEDVVKLPNGLKLDYYRIEKIPVVVLLPKLSDKIVMVKQYRYPIKSESLELPAGHVWPNEKPLDCAKRELKEETGFTAGKLEKIMSYNPSTEYSDQIYHIYIAEDLKKGKTNMEKHEIIDVVLLDADSIIEKIMDGTIVDGRTITSIFLAKFLNKL